MFLILLLNNSFQGLHQEISFILNQAQRVGVYLEQDVAQAGYSCKSKPYTAEAGRQITSTKYTIDFTNY